jgi:hypothetical protein
MRGTKTGGRRKGTPNRATVQRKALAEAGISAALTTGTSPLDVILAVMRGGPDAEGITDRQYAAACAAAPFIHPRLQSTHVSGSVLSGLMTMEERLERLQALEALPREIEGTAEPVQEES